MRTFQVLSCFLLNHPQFIRARSLDLIEDEIQSLATSKDRVDGDRYGELTFKHFIKYGYREVHAFFVNKRGSKRRFIKAVEVKCPDNDR